MVQHASAISAVSARVLARSSVVRTPAASAAKELEDHGVSVTCVSPGPTNTDFYKTMDKDGADNKELTKAGRKSPAEVATVALAALDARALSKMVGTRNTLRAWSARFAPRSLVAKLSKNLLRSQAND